MNSKLGWHNLNFLQLQRESWQMSVMRFYCIQYRWKITDFWCCFRTLITHWSTDWSSCVEFVWENSIQMGFKLQILYLSAEQLFTNCIIFLNVFCICSFEVVNFSGLKIYGAPRVGTLWSHKKFAVIIFIVAKEHV